jgi:signal transduction histidine kinase/DNA-binding response OmpR family regulator/streptogramin lyase
MPLVLNAAIMEQPFNFRHFAAEDGLTSNSIASICVDKKGCIWVGTRDGLFRYCGDSFKLIEPFSNENFEVSGINYMIIDQYNCIWIAANTGVFVYSPEYQKYTQVRLNTDDGNQFYSLINTLAEDKDGNIWFSTYGEGMLRYDRQTSSIKKYTFEGTTNFVDKVFVDSENIVWAAVRNKGKPLARLNKTTDKFEYLTVHYDNQDNSDGILTIFEDSYRALWLGTWLKGVQKLDKYSGSIRTYSVPSSGTAQYIHSIAEYQPDKLLIGSDDGLILLDALTGGSELFIPDISNPVSISDKFVYPITRDREGGVWIGTYYGGVNYISPFDGLFTGNSCSRFTNSKSGSIVSSICEADNGDIWLGTDDNGLIRYNPSDGSSHHFMPQPGKNSISYYNIHALCFIDDNLWIGTYTGGLNIYNTKNKRFKIYGKGSYSGPGNLSVYSIFKDRDGTMWIGTMAGIDVFDPESGSFVTKRSLGGTVTDIRQDMEGYIWFATQTDGIQCYNPSNEEWKEYVPKHPGESLANKCVNTIYIDETGAIWAGTSNGLCRFNSDQDAFESIFIRSQKDNISCIIGDNHILWISTTNGILRFDPNKGNCIAFSKSDGLQSDHFIPASGYKTRNGIIYFGSTNGFISFYPYKVRINEAVPDVMITGLDINNSPVAVGENSVLKKAINNLDRIELSPDQNDIIFHYSAISYYAPGKYNYAYRLVDNDEGWNYVSNLKSATYTNLSPGSYEFQVKSSNGSGIWSDDYKSIQIYIRPPLMLSPLFLILYVIIGISLIILIISYFVHRAEKIAQRNMEILNQKREKETYDEKIRFFTSIAHEIRTPLSLITGPIEQILAKDNHQAENIENDLNTINRNSNRLLSLVNQLLDLRKIEQESGIRLFFVMRNMPTLVNSVVETYMPYMIQYDVKLTLKQIDDFEAEVDPEAITKILSNLLTNAAKYARAKVDLKCIVNEEQKNFQIIVTDDGCGIPQNETENIFKPFYRISTDKTGTGIGLSIVRSIVSAHNGTVEVASVHDQGSSFIITIPLKQSKNDIASLPETIPDDILAVGGCHVDSEIEYSLLIVEDNKEMMVFLFDTLSSNYNVMTAKNGADALELLKTNEISIIVCDWMMPVMDGIELCKAIRQNIYISHIPFVMLTAKTDLNAKIEGMEAGVDIFIEKPFSVHYLCACIKSLIDTRKSVIEKFSRTPLLPLSRIAPNSSNEKFLSQISTIIEENISNTDLSVDFIVRQIHISRSGFFAKIKNLVEVTPNDLIQIIRLKKAAAMLLQNRYLVSEICYMVGFRNPSYFSKCFHKQFGVTPVDFIKSHNNAIANM